MDSPVRIGGRVYHQVKGRRSQVAGLRFQVSVPHSKVELKLETLNLKLETRNSRLFTKPRRAAHELHKPHATECHLAVCRCRFQTSGSNLSGSANSCRDSRSTARDER